MLSSNGITPALSGLSGLGSLHDFSSSRRKGQRTNGLPKDLSGKFYALDEYMNLLTRIACLRRLSAKLLFLLIALVLVLWSQMALAVGTFIPATNRIDMVYDQQRDI